MGAIQSGIRVFLVCRRDGHMMVALAQDRPVTAQLVGGKPVKSGDELEIDELPLIGLIFDLIYYINTIFC